MDDEEEMLYGDSGTPRSPPREEPRRGTAPQPDRDRQHRTEPSHWALLVRDNGAMEVRPYSTLEHPIAPYGTL